MFVSRTMRWQCVCFCVPKVLEIRIPFIVLLRFQSFLHTLKALIVLFVLLKCWSYVLIFYSHSWNFGLFLHAFKILFGQVRASRCALHALEGCLNKFKLMVMFFLLLRLCFRNLKFLIIHFVLVNVCLNNCEILIFLSMLLSFSLGCLEVLIPLFVLLIMCLNNFKIFNPLFLELLSWLP